MKDFEVVTVSSHMPAQDYYCYDQFIKSLQRELCKPIILGSPETFKGLGSKPKLLLKAIQDKTVDAKHIIFADSWDLVFARSPQEVIEEFKYFNAPFVCSAERNCFPSDLKDEYDKFECDTTFKYLNSGFIVADTEALLAVLESMDLSNVPDDYFDEVKNEMVHINDQFLFQQAFLKQPVKMALDYHQELSQTMHMVKIEELALMKQGNDPVIMNIETMSTPCTYHFNGGSKTSGTREIILKHLVL